MACAIRPWAGPAQSGHDRVAAAGGMVAMPDAVALWTSGQLGGLP